MSQSYEGDTGLPAKAGERDVDRIVGLATGLVLLNVLYMLAWARYEPTAGFLEGISNGFVLLGIVAVLAGGGYAIASMTEPGDGPLGTVVGLVLGQTGMAAAGALFLVVMPAAAQVRVTGMAILLACVLTGVVGYVVMWIDRSLDLVGRVGWVLASGGLFVGIWGGIVDPRVFPIGLALVPIGFLLKFAHMISRVRDRRYRSEFQAAVGLYFVVAGFFVGLVAWLVKAVLDFGK